MPRTNTIAKSVHHVTRRVRDAAILLAREFLTQSPENQARKFGGVARSSITETAKRARAQDQTDVTFRTYLATLRN